VGVAIYVSLEKGIPQISLDMDGKTLARHIDRLDRIAKKGKLPTLSDMISVSTAELEDMIGDEEQHRLEEQLNPKWVVRFLKLFDFVAKLLLPSHREEWFDPAAGLATVQLLIAHIRENPKDFADDREWLLRDLENAERYLTAAQEHKTRFHFSYDI
jgi:hypothetical protein